MALGGARVAAAAAAGVSVAASFEAVFPPAKIEEHLKLDMKALVSYAGTMFITKHSIKIYY